MTRKSLRRGRLLSRLSLALTVAALLTVGLVTPANALAVPPLAPTLPASLYRQTVSTLTAGGSQAVSAAEGILQRASVKIAFGNGLKLAGKANLVVLGLYAGYEAGMWSYTGTAPWEADPGTFGRQVTGSTVPRAYCFLKPLSMTTFDTNTANCTNSPQVQYQYNSVDGSWSASYSIITPYAVENKNVTTSLPANYPNGAQLASQAAYSGQSRAYCNGVATPNSYASASNRYVLSSTPTGNYFIQSVNQKVCPSGTGASFDTSKITIVLAGSSWSTSSPAISTNPATGKADFSWGTTPIFGIIGPPPPAGSWLPTTLSPMPTMTVNGVTYDPYAGYSALTNYGGAITGYVRMTTVCKGQPVDTWTSGIFNAYADRPQLPARVCPSGVLMQSQNATLYWSDGQTQVLFTYTAPDFYKQADGSAFTECLAAGAKCVLELKKVTSTGQVVACSVDPSPCLGWWADPAATTKYRCFWGPYALALSECEALRNTYETNSAAITDPSPGSATDPSVDTSAPPAPQPGTDPWASATPGLGNNCIPSGWEILNPFSLAKSVACVLKWAFIPTTVGAQFDTLRAELTSRPPGSLIQTAIVSFSSFIDGWSNSDCGSVLPWDFSSQHDGTGKLPCHPAGGPAWDFVYLLLTLAISGLVIWRLYAFAMSAFGSREEI